MRPPPPPILNAQDLACVRGERQLFCGLSFSLHPGELLHIDGANGCGKTSLLRILGGLSIPAAGEVLWQGRPIWQDRHSFVKELAYLGHHPGIKGELTPREHLKLASCLYFTRIGVDLDQVLIQAGLGEYRDTPARYLSAGQRQRLAIARLLLQQATLWILDEPFTSLDATGQAWLYTLLEEHLKKGGIAVLTSHQAVQISAQVVTLKL
ncbi:MAG: cytochrome c biogenesis heme-transporting ATPase CcmA [Methylohalobius sp.]|nr:cytochrome c biogenesis heme-transporting ATPase CcmA [Methylohalobius sp.]